MATINITADDTTGTNRATTLAALITAVKNGLLFRRGNKKYVRISDRVLDLSTANVTNVNFTDTAGGTKESNVDSVLNAVEGGKYTISGNKTYLRLGDSVCDASTSELPG